MAESYTLEFSLESDEIVRALDLDRARRNGFLTAVAMLVLAAVCMAVYEWGDRPRMYWPAILLLVYAISALVYSAIVVPRRTRANVGRLSGATRVKFDDEGVRYGGANTAKGFSWKAVEAVVERPESWVISMRKQQSGYVIPKSGVDQEQAEAFAAQLKEWAGKSYRGGAKASVASSISPQSPASTESTESTEPTESAELTESPASIEPTESTAPTTPESEPEPDAAAEDSAAEDSAAEDNAAEEIAAADKSEA